MLACMVSSPYLWILLVSALSLAASACGSSDDEGDEGKTGGTHSSSGGRTGSGGERASGGSGASSSDPVEPGDDLYGEEHQGQYHLGPVDFAQTDWFNACNPEGGYAQSLREGTGLGGEYLAGVSNSFAQGGGICDSCIAITTATGRSIVARVVTYGATNDPGDIDVSPSVYETLDTGEYPREMTWQLAKCPDTGPLTLEFQTGANEWWTSFWVRNQRVPLESVEVKSQNHSAYYELRRETDGTLNDDAGFGAGEFTLRLTAVDGQVITLTFPGFSPGEIIVSDENFE